jgi:hypothetical protein
MTIWLVIMIQGMSSPGLTGPDRLARLPVTPHVDSYVDLSGASGNTIVDLKSEAEALIVLRMGRANRHELLTSRSLSSDSGATDSHLVFVIRIARGEQSTSDHSAHGGGVLTCVELGSSHDRNSIAVRGLVTAMRRLRRGLVPVIPEKSLYTRSLLLAVLRDALEGDDSELDLSKRNKRHVVKQSRCFVTHVSFGAMDKSASNMFQGLGFAIHVHKEVVSSSPTSHVEYNYANGVDAYSHRDNQDNSNTFVSKPAMRATSGQQRKELWSARHRMERGKSSPPAATPEQRWVSLAGGQSGTLVV